MCFLLRCMIPVLALNGRAGHVTARQLLCKADTDTRAAPRLFIRRRVLREVADVEHRPQQIGLGQDGSAFAALGCLGFK